MTRRARGAGRASTERTPGSISELPAVAFAAETFFDLSLDLLCIAGTDGRFRKVNPAFTRVLGWTRDQLLARPF